MEKSRVLGLTLAALCVITSEYACNGSESNPATLFDFGNDLNDPENRLSSWQGSNSCQWQGCGCNNNNGAVVVIDPRKSYPVNSESSSRYGFWNLIGDISPSLLKLRYLEYLDSSLDTFNKLDYMEYSTKSW
ncbi:Uncharacterized protein TCM_025506 [Theobroma cacao]|uniref:Leucine-rich repeat-containing N-terminal plant-type domain-containing protein n=1 Tax=Theobroma cacao TaxID=3641 RepID=A0A061F0D7_THECC|nr:Uncharacterized protein TCM_025506 [Theobroma cacao]